MYHSCMFGIRFGARIQTKHSSAAAMVSHLGSEMRSSLILNSACQNHLFRLYYKVQEAPPRETTFNKVVSP